MQMFHNYFFHHLTQNTSIVDEQNYIQAADMLSTDLSHIHNWSQNWAIKFNPNKTESILFTRRNINNPPVYSLYNLDLDEFTLNPVIILPAST
jgi:hypothetical protein